MRKRRSDRKHAIYCITNVMTGEKYVGLTVTQGAAVKRAVKVRFQKHVSRALKESKDWAFCEAIRFYGKEAFKHEVLEVVRGRKDAHQVERKYIRKLKPVLNSF